VILLLARRGCARFSRAEASEKKLHRRSRDRANTDRFSDSVYKRPPKKTAGMTMAKVDAALVSLARKGMNVNYMLEKAQTDASMRRAAKWMIETEVNAIAVGKVARAQSVHAQCSRFKRTDPIFRQMSLGIFRVECSGPGCRRVFYTTYPQALYCCAACRSKARTRRNLMFRRMMREKKCCRCHETFKAARGDARFCSGRCRVAYFRRIRRNMGTPLKLFCDSTSVTPSRPRRATRMKKR
jgi:hypothetical protein